MAGETGLHVRESHKGGSGHLTVIPGERRSQLPMHGGGKELGTGLVNKIKKDLGTRLIAFREGFVCTR